MKQSVENYTKYLDPKRVSKLKSLDLKAKYVVEGFMVGLHKSPYHGFSVEFTQHRPYMQGDDLKRVDWKVYGKTDRFFIKQFEEETNLRSHIILDSSGSMSYASEGNISKLEYGLILAASLSYLMIKQQDAVGLIAYSDKMKKYLPPKSRRNYLQEILLTLSSLEPVEKTKISDALFSSYNNIKGRGLIIVVSDFFDDFDLVINTLKTFRYKKNEVIVFQILDPLEKSFAFGKDAVFKDIETDEEISTQPYQIQRVYQQSMESFLYNFKVECAKLGIEYNLILTDENFDRALYSYIQKRKMLY